MSRIPPKRHLDLTVNSEPQLAAEELPKIQENRSQSCGGNTRIGTETRSFNNVSVWRQGRYERTAVTMSMNEHSWETWLGMSGCATQCEKTLIAGKC